MFLASLADCKVPLRAHQVKVTNELVFIVIDLIIKVGEIKKYTKTRAYVWVHAVANIVDSNPIHNYSLVIFPWPCEEPKGTPCISALGLLVF